MCSVAVDKSVQNQGLSTCLYTLVYTNGYAGEG